jgi:hypothetical protein
MFVNLSYLLDFIFLTGSEVVFDVCEDDSNFAEFRVMDKDVATADDAVGVASVDYLPYTNKQQRITIPILSGEEETGKIDVTIEFQRDVSKTEAVPEPEPMAKGSLFLCT